MSEVRHLQIKQKKEELWFSTKAHFQNIGDYIVIVNILTISNMSK